MNYKEYKLVYDGKDEEQWQDLFTVTEIERKINIDKFHDNPHTILKIYGAPDAYKIRDGYEICEYLAVYCPGDIVIRYDNKQLTATETKRKNTYQVIEIIGIDTDLLQHSVYKKDGKAVIVEIDNIEDYQCVCGEYFVCGKNFDHPKEACGLDHIDIKARPEKRFPIGWGLISTTEVYGREDRSGEKERIINIDGRWSYVKDYSNIDSDKTFSAYKTLYGTGDF
jgi:hypothetical protein